MNNKILFKGIGIDCHLTEISFKTKRNDVKIATPFGQNIIQGIGNATTIIKISGELFGAESKNDLDEMEKLLLLSESGVLKIPGKKDIKAFFVSLSKKESNLDGSIAYYLEFLKENISI